MTQFSELYFHKKVNGICRSIDIMAKGRNEAVSELLKNELARKAEQLIRKKFMPGLPAQAEAAKQHGFNYIADVYTVWRGRSLYFCAKYCNPREDAKEK